MYIGVEQDEIDYLLKQNPRKLVGGYNLTGLENTLMFYHFYKNLNWSQLMTKYFDVIQKSCLCDQIITFDNDKTVVIK